MSLSQLQVGVLLAALAVDAVPVAALVKLHERDGVGRPVARAIISRSLRRLWRMGAVELHGTPANGIVGFVTGSGA